MAQNNLQDYCQSQLLKAAMDYLYTGIDLFKKHQSSSVLSGYQAAIGNLSLSIELMLKTFIAGKHLTLLYKNLPLELRAFLNCEDRLPESFQKQPFEIDIRSSTYTTIELDECISLFYIFFPDERPRLQPHLRFVSKVRNLCVHSFLPVYYRFELERVAFTALNIYKVLYSSFPVERLGYLTCPPGIGPKDKW